MIYLFRCTKDLEISPRKQSKDMLASYCMYKTHENNNVQFGMWPGNKAFKMHMLCCFLYIDPWKWYNMCNDKMSVRQEFFSILVFGTVLRDFWLHVFSVILLHVLFRHYLAVVCTYRWIFLPSEQFKVQDICDCCSRVQWNLWQFASGILGKCGKFTANVTAINFNPILHTTWLESHALTLKNNTAKNYFSEKSSFLHTLLNFSPESRTIQVGF
jgi:hypothetical protein